MTDENVNATAQANAPVKEPTTPEVDYKAEYEKAQAEIERLKNGITKTSAEVSKVKKELADRMTKEEAAELARKEAEENIRKELAEYKERDRIATYKDKLIASGYDAESAYIMAKALPEGVGEEYFEVAKKHFEDAQAKAKADAINNQPKLTAGSAPKPIDPELEQMRKAAGLA